MGLCVLEAAEHQSDCVFVSATYIDHSSLDIRVYLLVF